nr:immunoglobulin heavy chain junction region [Macaca mulatta]
CARDGYCSDIYCQPGPSDYW